MAATTDAVSTSGVKGTTATIRGTPSTPLNKRVADTIACLFCSCTCFAWFFLFSRVCAAVAAECELLMSCRLSLPKARHKERVEPWDPRRRESETHL